MPETTEQRRNWAPWLALLFVLAVIGLNVAALFLNMPGQWLVPWLSLLFGFAGMVWGVKGVWRVFRQSHLYGGKITCCIVGALALLLFALVVIGQFHARDLPASTGAPKVGQKAPDFTLSDSNGSKVSLGQMLNPAQNAGAMGSEAAKTNAAGNSMAPRAVLLIFYRGYW